MPVELSWRTRTGHPFDVAPAGYLRALPGATPADIRATVIALLPAPAKETA